MYNGSGTLERCLRAIGNAAHAPQELIVADDGSTDGSGEIAEKLGARVVRLERNAGSSAARNAAARLATGEVLVFLDADTEVHGDTLGRIADRFAEDAGLDAVFGAYDDTPSDEGVVSRFRNLMHCYTHKDAPRQANTFWAGCGAMRRESFERTGGFDEQYEAASTEDVDLGMRLARSGGRIETDPSIQVKHLKRWTLGTMVKTDLLHRAIPFGELMVRERRYPRVLGKKQLASAVVLALLLPWLAATYPPALLLGLLAYLGINVPLLRFLRQKGGWKVAAAGSGLLVLHHVCGAMGVAIGAARYGLRRLSVKPTALAAAAMLAVAGWQAATVNTNFQRQWTALFCTGEKLDLPPELQEGTYRFPRSPGYDGQFYRLVAHDPWLQKGYARHADSAAVRWRRILVPAVAWALALGSTEWIDAAYILLVVLLCGLGVHALSRLSLRRGRHPAVGLLFVALPGTLVCIDRMTVDVALYALLFLCVLWDEDRSDARLWAGLALCALVRDLGFLVIAAFVLSEGASRRWRRAAWMTTAALPAAAWYAALRALLPRVTERGVSPEMAVWAFKDVGYGIFERMLKPRQYNLDQLRAAVATVADEIALAGMAAAVILTLVRFRWRTAGKLEWVGMAFLSLFFVVGSSGFWRDAYSWPRAFTPTLAALALGSGTAPRWLWLPMAAVVVRVGLQFGTQVEGIIRAIR